MTRRAARPVRVLQVVQRFFPELGGTETHVAEVTRRLAERDDVDVTVLTTDRTGELDREAEVDGVPVLRRKSWPREADYYLAPGIVRVIREGGWDLVHFQGVHTLVPPLGMLAARSAGIPYVLSFHSGGHSSAARESVRGAQWRVLTPLLAGAERLIAVSRFEKRRFSELTGIPAERFSIVQNGGRLPAVPADVHPVPGRILSSGRLEQYKGHHRAIEALAVLRRTEPDAHLVVLGSGPYEADLRALADTLGVADAVSVRHLPPADRSAMARELASASVMAAMSSYEAHPVAVMEAVAIGLPVVGADVAGIGDLVEDGLVTGVDLDATPEELAAALSRVLATAPTVGPRPLPDVALPTWETCAAGNAEVYLDVLDVRAATRPRVAHVITTLLTGGAERQLELLVDRSELPSATVALYQGGPVADAMRAAGHRVEVLGMSGWRKPLAVARLARRLRRLRPDVVHVHLLAAQLWGIPAARLAGVRTVVSTEHSLMADTIENRPLTPTLRRLYLLLERLSTRTVAVSAETRERLVAWGVPPERIEVVPNGVDVAALAFRPAARTRLRGELGLGDEVEVLGAVGRLEPVKRFPQLLRAVAPGLAAGRRELVVVGDGPLRAQLEAEARSLGVADAVHVLGPRSDVADLLCAVDVLVSPSWDETYGLAVVEALAAGLPVVFAACPALDALPEPPPWAHPLATTGASPEAEQDALRAGVERALAGSVGEDGTRHRHPVPVGLAEVHGIEGTARRLDDLYAALHRRR